MAYGSEGRFWNMSRGGDLPGGGPISP